MNCALDPSAANSKSTCPHIVTPESLANLSLPHLLLDATLERHASPKPSFPLFWVSVLSSHHAG
jgi:hypothetical protein